LSYVVGGALFPLAFVRSAALTAASTALVLSSVPLSVAP
jgi:hypothetical protein